jgi:RNA polymerase sigma-70 factor (ECF subfamily)
MSDVPDFQHNLLASIPRLRAFAVGLCGTTERADDLVQEALVRAWANRASFQQGTNMIGWLFVILRNAFYGEFRKRRHEVADVDGQYAATLSSEAAQEGHIEFKEFRAALQRLPTDQREALLLIASSGLSYEEAASICQCAVGTVKSRVSRARTRLAEILLAPEVKRPRPTKMEGETEAWGAGTSGTPVAGQ